MVSFKKTFFIFAVLLIGSFLSFLYLTNKKPITLEYAQDFPYLEVQLCVDSESSNIIKKINVFNYQDSDINNAITQSIKKCNVIIEELMALIIQQANNENPKLQINIEQKNKLKNKIQDNLFLKYKDIYNKNADNIIKHANNPNYTQNALLKAEQKNTLDNFLQEKIDQSNIEFNNMVLFLIDAIKKKQ